jgi:hypothetical protein
VDRSACFELRVSDIRRISGCIPIRIGSRGNTYRDKNRAELNVPGLPNEKQARNGKGRISCGYWDISAYQMNALARTHMPRRLGGDWRSGRAPAMRPAKSQLPSMSLEQGGYGPGSYGYEQKQAQAAKAAMFAGVDDSQAFDGAQVRPPLPRPSWERGLSRDGSGALDAGLDGNPNRGATREKRFGLGLDWTQRLSLEKWSHNSVSGVQYFLICPGVAYPSEPRSIGCAYATGLKRSSVDAKGLKGMTGTTSNCGDGSRGAHGKGWVCGQRVYKLFWVLGRPGEHRDALLAEQWIASLTSGQLARQSAAVSALVDRYGPIMGDDRMLRCRRCLRLRYGQSPEVLRKKRRRAGVSPASSALASRP